MDPAAPAVIACGMRKRRTPIQKAIDTLLADPRVANAWSEGDNGCGDYRAGHVEDVWVDLKPGFISDEETHSIHEETPARLIDALGGVRPCDCDGCLDALAKAGARGGLPAGTRSNPAGDEGGSLWPVLGGLAAGAAVVGGLAYLLRPREASAMGMNYDGSVVPGIASRPEDGGTTFGFNELGGRLTGTAFIDRIKNMSESAYRRAVADAIIAGSIPQCFARFTRVDVASRGMTGTFWISPMPLAVGTDADMFHAPLPVATVQRIANHFGLLLPTSKMVDAARLVPGTIRIPFQSKPDPHQAIATYITASNEVEAQRAGRVGNITDFYKTYVLDGMRLHDMSHCIIYGAWRSSGSRVQEVSIAHGLGYGDYSQEGLVVWPQVLVGGRSMPYADAVTSATYWHIFSDDSVPLDPTLLRYPT